MKENCEKILKTFPNCRIFMWTGQMVSSNYTEVSFHIGVKYKKGSWTNTKKTHNAWLIIPISHLITPVFLKFLYGSFHILKLKTKHLFLK